MWPPVISITAVTSESCWKSKSISNAYSHVIKNSKMWNIIHTSTNEYLTAQRPYQVCNIWAANEYDLPGIRCRVNIPGTAVVARKPGFKISDIVIVAYTTTRNSALLVFVVYQVYKEGAGIIILKTCKKYRSLYTRKRTDQKTARIPSQLDQTK